MPKSRNLNARVTSVGNEKKFLFHTVMLKCDNFFQFVIFKCSLIVIAHQRGSDDVALHHCGAILRRNFR
jgi:hypothetical protein